MRGATFLLVVNFFIGLSFAAAFLGVARQSRSSLGRWCTAGFLCAAGTVTVEALAPLLSSEAEISLLSSSLLLAGVTLIAAGIARHYRPDASILPILALFVAAEALNLALRPGLPRGTLAYTLLYQMPYAAMLALAAGFVLDARRRRTVDAALAAVLAAGALHFLAKALLPLVEGLQAPGVRDYILSAYGYYSQTLGAVLSLLLGLALLGVLVDEVMSETRHALQRDGLSGALNRAAFIERAGVMLARLANGRTACLVMVDLDHFKSINDRFGHAAGDEVIRAVGAVLTRAAGGDALCGRLGGEEFCLLLPEEGTEGARRRVEAIRAALAGLVFARLPPGERVTASFGMALAREGAVLDEVLDAADRALYAAKQAGRDRYALAVEADGASLAAARLRPR
ncbi:GGDEF domain-containing protein [Starkeya koreensis]|uniref:diguanylate cyclase n=1 Tax=Ancylobacter koreensis TaxID=266121 RepID=A0ABT0DPU6_9HYPH|nr:GGDEF domain-containing protein [Ancylobacter koreensis]MCK0209209.1 GGDEF domain-containing protein [Ancylobacter koreensis]